MAIISILVAVVVASTMMKTGEAVPVNGDSSAQKTTSEISGLRDNAQVEVYKIHQQMTRLEPLITNGTFDLFHQTCYKRSSAICKVDINTIKDDVTSLTQLLPVIQQLVNNETDEYIIAKFNETVKFVKSSITALNSLIEASDSQYTAPVAPIDNYQYEDLDKIVKLSILKLQVDLTFNDLDHLLVD